jgi:hypothetical protein
MQNEKRLEQRLVKKVKEKGGLCLKWTSPGTTGVPDRLVILHGQVRPVELKDPKGKLSLRQNLMISELARRGVPVAVLWSDEDVDNFVDEL